MEGNKKQSPSSTPLQCWRGEKVLIFSLPEFFCVVVTSNLFLRLKMFDPYNLSKEQDWVLTEQLMMIHQPVNSICKEERAMWIRKYHWMTFFFRFEKLATARGWLTNCLKVSGHISFVFSESLTYIYPNTPVKTMESALTAFNIWSVFVPGNNILIFLLQTTIFKLGLTFAAYINSNWDCWRTKYNAELFSFLDLN